MTDGKARIAWISQYPLSGVSFGAITHQYLSRLSQKYNFYCLSFGYDGQPLNIGGYVILPFRSQSEIDFYWNEIKPDLVVLFHSFFALPKVMARGRFSEPSILYIPIEGPRLPIQYQSYLENFDRILVPSKWSKDSLERDQFNAEVLYHGVESDYFTPFDRHNKKISFGYFGSNDIRKQVPKIMKAFKLLKGNKQLNLATPIHGYLDYADVAKELGIVPKFQKAYARGLSITVDKIRFFYWGLDIYVGMGTEAFGLPPLEAASTEIPNIAMDYAASPEILGKSALYVKPVTTDYTPLGEMGVIDEKDLAKVMQYLLQDENERKRLGKLGRERAKEFPWEKSINQLDKTIKEELKIGKSKH